MPKASIETQLDDLAGCRADPAAELSRQRLSAAFKSKSTLVVEKAAGIIIAANLGEYLPAIAEAFDRIFTAGDKGCIALTPLANALYTFGHSNPGPFLLGIRHFQPVPFSDPPADRACDLRGLCALGLARMGYADLLLEMAELLNDPMPQARQMAARAIAYAGHDAGALLLRMRVLIGDRDAEVMAECFTALMKVSPRKSMPFVARYLPSPDDEKVDPAIGESAALAIGGSKLPEAFLLLKDEWEKHILPELRRPLLLGIAMTRQPAAVDFVIERITQDRPAPAVDAITAMAMYRHDAAIRARIAAAVTAAANPAVTGAFQKSLGE